MRIAETQRTWIERIELSDAELFFRLLNSPGWKRFVGDRGVPDLPAAEDYLREKMLPVYEQYGFGYYVIRSHDAASLGICGFLKKPHLENPDFGFALLPEFQGRGLAEETARAVLSFGIETFGFTVLDAETHPENQASIHLLKKLEFQAAGTFTKPNTSEESLLFRWRRA